MYVIGKQKNAFGFNSLKTKALFKDNFLMTKKMNNSSVITQFTQTLSANKDCSLSMHKESYS